MVKNKSRLSKIKSFLKDKDGNTKKIIVGMIGIFIFGILIYEVIANVDISLFDVKNPNNYVVDIYSKDQVKLDFSPQIKDYALFTKDGRCGATGNCACALKNGQKIGYKGWRCVDFTNATKVRNDTAYNFRFNKYSTTNFMLVGIKNNPADTVKWGFGTNSSYLDPIWFGEISNITTSNSSVEIRINLTTDYMKNATWSWEGNNYTIYKNSLIFSSNLDNNTNIGDNGTLAVDNSIYSNNASFGPGAGVNVTWITNGVYGAAVDFKGGKYGYLAIQNSTPGTTTGLGSNSNFTITLWMQEHKDMTGRQTLIGTEWDAGGYGFAFSVGGYTTPESLELRVNGADSKRIYKTYNFTENQWYFVAVSYGDFNQTCKNSACNTKLYINGEEIGYTYASLQPINYTSRLLGIGAENIVSLSSTGSRIWNGSIDEVNIYNESLPSSIIKQIYMTQLKNYNFTNWGFYANESLNQSSMILNKTNPTKNHNYFLCSGNLTQEICSNQATVIQTIPNKIMRANFTDTIGNVASDFYGVNIQGPSWLVSGYSYDTNCDGISDTAGNITLNRQEYENGLFGAMRFDYYFDSWYTVLNNFGLEEWSNPSVGFFKVASGSGARGWSVSVSGGGNGTVSRSTDAHSGSYSLNVTGIGASRVFLYHEGINVVAGRNYNVSVWLKGNGTTKLVFKQITPSIGCYSGGTITLNNTWVQYTGNCTASSNETNFAIVLDSIQPNETLLLDDWEIYENNQPLRWWRKGDLTNTTNLLKYNANLGKRSLVIFWSNNPSGLANWSNPLCFSNSTQETSCYPYDYNIADNITLDAIKRLTEENSTLENLLDLEFKNEPYGTHGYCTYDNVTCALANVEHYNHTYTVIKNYNSNIQMGGPSGYTMTSTPNFMKAFMSNLTDRFDFITFHPYASYYTVNNNMLTYFDDVRNNCTALGGGHGCSRIIDSESLPNSPSIVNSSNGQSNRFKSEITTAFLPILNSAPANSSLHYYHWKDKQSYFNCPSRYGYYPYLYSSISDIGMDNLTSAVYYPSYTQQKKIARLCPAGSVVKRTYSETEYLQITTCISENQYGVIINNRGTTSFNGTIDLNGAYPYSKISNYDTGDVYSLPGGNLSYGVIDAYDTIFLVRDSSVPPTITLLNPSNFIISKDNLIKFSANLTDDVGLENATLYIVDTDKTSSLIKKTVIFVGGEKSTIQDWNVYLDDGKYNWWVELWDDEGKLTTSSNYSLTVRFESESGGAVDTGGGGTGSGTWDTEPITLDHIEVEWDNFYWNKGSYIYITILDINNTLITLNTSNIKISIISPNDNIDLNVKAGAIQKLTDGRYRQSFNIKKPYIYIDDDGNEVKLNEVEINVLVVEGLKQIEKNYIIPISDLNLDGLSKITGEDLLDWVKINFWKLIIGLAVLIFIIIIVKTLSKN